MRRTNVALAAWLALALGPPLWADEAYEKLVKEFEEAQQAFYKAAQDADGAGKDFDWSKNPSQTFTPKFQAYAATHAGKPEACPALVWLVTEAQPDFSGGKMKPSPVATDALQQLGRDHAAQPYIKDHLKHLRRVYTVSRADLLTFLERVRSTNSDRDVLARVTFALGATYFGDGPPADTDANREADTKRATELLRAVGKEFPESEAAKVAESYLFELENLQLGMTAPDFEGEDSGGTRIKLSQFRGQVVVLDFWGFW